MIALIFIINNLNYKNMETVKMTMVENKEMKSNNSIVINMEELTKKLKKEEKVLQHLAKSKADTSVITVQEQIVSQLKAQYEKAVAKEVQAKEHIGDSLMTFGKSSVSCPLKPSDSAPLC